MHDRAGEPAVSLKRKPSADADTGAEAQPAGTPLAAVAEPPPSDATLVCHGTPSLGSR
jgi:hypothetical protein